jgi:hypothetical protein
VEIIIILKGTEFQRNQNFDLHKSLQLTQPFRKKNLW